jgi:hypothetical protein
MRSKFRRLFIYVCTHVGLFYFRIGLRAFSFVEILYICEKKKPTTGRVGVYKQFGIDNEVEIQTALYICFIA